VRPHWNLNIIKAIATTPKSKDNGIHHHGRETPDEHVTRRPPNNDAPSPVREPNQRRKIHGRPTLPWSTLEHFPEEYNTDYANLTNDTDKATTIEVATEMWKATHHQQQQNRFDQLKKELHNNYIGETKIVTLPHSMRAYTRLNQII
jgi:hypothetical protein